MRHIPLTVHISLTVHNVPVPLGPPEPDPIRPPRAGAVNTRRILGDQPAMPVEDRLLEVGLDTARIIST